MTGIIENSVWAIDREREEFSNRQALLELARKNAMPNDWFVYLDADERVEVDWRVLLNSKADAIDAACAMLSPTPPIPKITTD